jgi:chorismate mutase
MKTPVKVLLALLLLLAGASSVVAWREYLELIALRAAAPDPDERVRLQKAAWDAQKRANQLAAELAAARATSGTPAGGSEDQTRTLGEYASQMIARIDDPEVRRLMEIVQKGQIDRRFASLFRTLKLTPDQLAQFQHLLVERQETGTDVLIAASQQGINPMQDPQQFRQMVQQAQNDIDDKIKTTLGADDYAQFQNFQQTQSQRGTADQLQQDLSYTDTPLTDTQKDQLTQIIAQSAPAGGGGGAINDTTVSLAQGILSAPQLQALQNLRQVQQANGQLQQLISRPTGGGSPPGKP